MNERIGMDRRGERKGGRGGGEERTEEEERKRRNGRTEDRSDGNEKDWKIDGKEGKEEEKNGRV